MAKECTVGVGEATLHVIVRCDCLPAHRPDNDGVLQMMLDRHGLQAKPHPTLRQAFHRTAELITRSAQSQVMAHLVNTSAQKYLELAQKAFGGAAASGAQADLIRSLTENYATFAREHAESLMGMAAAAQAQMNRQMADASKIMNSTDSS